MNQKFKQRNRDYLMLSIWLVVGLALLILNYLALEFVKSVSQSEVFGWLNLVGGSIYLLAGMMIVFIVDALYIILFLRWIFYSRKHRDQDTLYLP